MKSINDFKFQVVWQAKEERLSQELISFWTENEVLDDKLRVHRARQAALVIRDNLNKIVGVSTVAKIFHAPLNNHVYLYRCFIAPKARTAGLDTMLTKKTRDYLESIYKEDEPMAVGFLIVVQSEFLKKWKRAVWPGLDMMYIGNTESGDPIRIYYFKGVKI